MAGEWTETTLGDICELRAGSAFPPTLQGKPIGKYPFAKVSDMNLAANSIRLQEANNWVNDDDLPQLKAKPFPVGTVVFAKIGEALRANRLRSVIRPTIIDNNMMGAVPVEGAVDQHFFFYALSQFDFGEAAVGTALPYLTVGALSQLEMSLPPLPEQLAIAHILGTLDDKIELNRRMSETLEAMARALFKSWFVDFEPVRAKAEARWRRGESLPGLPAYLFDLFPDSFEDSELGEIPKGWEVNSLDEIARFLNGLALQKYPPNGERSLPVIKIAQLRSGRTDDTDHVCADLDPDYVVVDGDILFSWSGSLECDVWAGGPGALNQHLFKVTSTKYPRWLCYFAIHHHLEDFRHIASGKATTMGHIQRHHLSDAKVVAPAQPMPPAIDEVLSQLFECHWKRDVEYRTLAALRDTLLPKLISGELRIEDTERFLSGD